MDLHPAGETPRVVPPGAYLLCPTREGSGCHYSLVASSHIRTMELGSFGSAGGNRLVSSKSSGIFCVRRVGGVHCFCEDRPMLDLCEGAPAALLSSRHLGKAFDPLAAMAQVARPANSDELPSGVPLVSHLLWLELAEALPFGYI